MKSSANLFPYLHLLKQLADVEQPAEDSVAARFYWKDGFLWALEFSGTPILIGPVTITPPPPYNPIAGLDSMPEFQPTDLLRFADVSDMGGMEKSGTIADLFVAGLPPQATNAGKVLKTDGTTATWQPDNDTTYTLTGLLPPQSGQNGKVLKTDGTTATWQVDLDSGMASVPDPLTIGTLNVTTLATLQAAVVTTTLTVTGFVKTGAEFHTHYGGFDAANYQRGIFKATGTSVELNAEAAGVYAAANISIVLTPKGTGQLVVPANMVMGATSGDALHTISRTNNTTYGGVSWADGGVPRWGLFQYPGGNNLKLFSNILGLPVLDVDPTGTFNFSKGFAFQGIGPTTGISLNGGYYPPLDYAYIQSYDYVNGAYKKLLLDGLTICLNGNSQKKVGVNTLNPLTNLDVNQLNGDSGLHVGNDDTGRGFYVLHPAGTNDAVIANAAYVSAQWIPKHNYASLVAFTGNGLAVYSDIGLTAGVPYIPTVRFNVGHDGNVGIGTAPPASVGLSVTTVAVNGPNGAAIEFRRNDLVFGLVFCHSSGFYLGSQLAGLDTHLTYGAGLIGASLTANGNLLVVGGIPVITDSTTARTLVLTDAGAYIRLTNAASCAVTVPPQSSVVWIANAEITIRVAGAVSPTVVPGAGVTVNNFAAAATIPQHGTFTLKRIATDVWDLI